MSTVQISQRSHYVFLTHNRHYLEKYNIRIRNSKVQYKDTKKKFNHLTKFILFIQYFAVNFRSFSFCFSGKIQTSTLSCRRIKSLLSTFSANSFPLDTSRARYTCKFKMVVRDKTLTLYICFP